MSRLHEADEPLPWQRKAMTEWFRLIGPSADEFLTTLLNHEPQFGIIKCNGCGRWQDFPPPHTFVAMRAAAKAVGWKRTGAGSHALDFCPICVGN